MQYAMLYVAKRHDGGVFAYNMCIWNHRQMTTRTLKSIFMQAIADTLGDLGGREWIWLLSPRGHITLLSTRWANMTISRVIIMAGIFGVLTPMWSVIDWFAFPFNTWLMLFGGRIVATVGFVILLLYMCGEASLRRARWGLVYLFAIPTLFYLYGDVVLQGVSLRGNSKAVAVMHTFLPFIVLTGLSVFALTLFEALVLAVPMLLSKIILAGFFWPPLGQSAAYAAGWLLLLVTVVAIMASISQLSFVIALVRQAIRDPLTGCFSRQSGEELLELQFNLSLRSNTPLSVAFLDIDFFKRVNDEFGHDAGDQTLIDAVQQILQKMRSGNMLVRWGGEEFIIIMPNTDLTKARVALERLCSSGFGLRPEGTPLTASIGIAERTADDAPNWRAIVDVADGRMYQAKHAGRARIVAA